MAQINNKPLLATDTQVHKFGGSSLADASRFQAVADIIDGLTSKQLWVVVSAPGDTTDELLAIIALASQPEQLQHAIEHLAQKLSALVRTTLPSESADVVIAELQQWLADIPAALLQQRYNDVLAMGEKLSALLLSQLLNSQGAAAIALDARDFLTLQQHDVQWQRSGNQLVTLNKPDCIHVVTGYIARDQFGNSITLGRNGSDYSATIIGRLVQADSVTIWTDVDAIYSTDPRRVKQAIPYRQVSWQQAALLAQLGNPVLHARTLSALEETRTSLVVRSSFQPQKAGCTVTAQIQQQTEFLTELNKVVLLRLHTQDRISAAQLALQLQQAVIELPSDAESQNWLLPESVLAQGLKILVDAGIHAVHDTQHYYAVGWIKAYTGKTLHTAAKTYLEQLAPAHRYENKALAVWLFNQPLTASVLAELHQHIIRPQPELQILVAGSGNVGSEFLNLLTAQQQRLSGQIKLNLAAVFNSRQACLQPDINAAAWQSALEQAADYQYSSLLAYVQSLPEPKVLVDITPSQRFALSYPDFIAAGCHIISANKQGVTLPDSDYQHIKQSLQTYHKQWFSNTTVGAGIPVQRVLQELLNSGDQIRQVSGIFSGTLSWLLCRYDGSKPFSDYVLEAQQLGLTEPDPRDDLSGKDVQRKLLVLARELGLTLELEQIALQPLLPAELQQGDWQAFWQSREYLDHALHTAYVTAKAQGKVLRYVARLQVQPTVTANVALIAVPADDPLATITPCDNIFVIESNWYLQNPLVLKGPGAGRQVTAGGIHADLAVLAQGIIQASYRF